MLFRGANSAAERGVKTPATAALAAALRERRLTYLALGPLTNLATLLRSEPTLRDRIVRVVFLGGQRPSAQSAETTARRDRRSADRTRLFEGQPADRGDVTVCASGLDP